MTRMPLARTARLLGTFALCAGLAAVLAAAAAPGRALAQGELDFCNERCVELAGECSADCDAGDDDCTERCRADSYACRSECNSDGEATSESPAASEDREAEEPADAAEPADPDESAIESETGEPPGDDEREANPPVIQRPDLVDDDPAEQNRRLPK